MLIIIYALFVLISIANRNKYPHKNGMYIFSSLLLWDDINVKRRGVIHGNPLYVHHLKMWGCDLATYNTIQEKVMIDRIVPFK